MSLPETTAISIAGVTEVAGLAKAVRLRSGIFEMTQAAEDAVLRPNEAGRWPHALRAALAARIARANGEEVLAGRYLADAAAFAALADPSNDGGEHGLPAVLAFMDKVSTQTRDVDAADIAALKSAGVSDADIVRLAELNAFVSYQVRVIAGLRLLQEGA